MFAGQFIERRRIELVDAPEPVLSPTPAANEPGDLVFQPEVACLCGSDLPFFDAEFDGLPQTYPLDVGLSLHEMIGSVVATNGKRFQPGDRVLAVPLRQMGFFERYLVSETRVIPLDPLVPDEHAMLAQPLGTVLHALMKLPNLLDRDVAVVGQGPIGQMFTAAVRNMGARFVIGVDVLDSRLAMSRRMGANATVCNADVDPTDAILQITGGQLPDVVIEAVGHIAQSLELCARLCRPGGRVLFFGVPPASVDGTRWYDIMAKNITIHTSLHPSFERTFPLAMRFIAEGRIDVSPLITHRFPLARIQEAFDVFRDRRDGAQKVVLEFPAWKR